MKLNTYLANHKVKYPLEAGDIQRIERSKLTARNPAREQQWQRLITYLIDEMANDRLHGHAVYHGRELAEWIKWIPTNQQDDLLTLNLEQAIRLRTISEELITLFADIPRHHIDIFVRRSTAQRPTLEELAEERGVTRERIRQIGQQIRHRIVLGLSAKPWLRIQSAISIAKEMGAEITNSVWTDRISRSGLLGDWKVQTECNIPSSISPLELMVAVCNLGQEGTAQAMFALPGNLRLIMGLGDISAETVKATEHLSKIIVRDIRKQAKNGGAVHVPSVSMKLKLPNQQTPNLLLRLGYERITDEWYMLRPSREHAEFNQSWAVIHTVLRMLKYCGALEIDQVYNGLRRHAARKGHVVPPPVVLSHVLKRYRFLVQDGYVSWEGDNPCTASTSEAVVLKVIEELGPAVSHFDLVQAFLRCRLSIPALSAVLRYSPLFVRVDLGLYKLRGKTVLHGDIEKARLRQPVTDANAEVRFNTNGTIHLRLNLGSVAIASGVIFVTLSP